MRTPIIAGNWKMNTTLEEAKALVRELMAKGLGQDAGVEQVVCPPFISLSAVAELLWGTPVKVGAQNMYSESKGAYTGEVSPLMLSELCQYVILGHSERRHIFGESNQVVNAKVKAALHTGLTPILCVGERLEEREANRTQEVVVGQVQKSLEGVTLATGKGIVIAYEPVWAIGTGLAATAGDANQVIGLIRDTVAHIYGDSIAVEMRIQYGGSVTPANATELMAQRDIDGALVGGASLKAEDFMEIVRLAGRAKG
ncbi:MAG: triose-phosphate isomerase [Dehalococcoidia bacterium]